MSKRQLSTENRLKLIVDAAESKKAEDIEIMNLRDRTLIADYFVVCSGSSDIHIRSVVDGIRDALADHGMKRSRIEGYSEARWVLIDAEDVVVHVFARDEREFYDLESIWRKTKATLEVERPSSCNSSGLESSSF